MSTSSFHRHGRVVLGLLVILVRLNEPLRSQEKTPEETFQFLPGTMLFVPITASWQEPRLGVRLELGSTRLKLDLGGALEFLEYRSPGSTPVRMRAAVEFFAYGLTTSANGLRLQVDALDGYFGGYVAARVPCGSNTLDFRLRIMHLSSHFVDGHLGGDFESIDGRVPTPYTRDFGELVITPSFLLGPSEIHVYGGVSYSTLARPEDLARWGGLAGVEVWSAGLFGTVFGRPFSVYCAVHTQLEGIPQYSLTTNVEAGFKFGQRTSSGIRCYAEFFSGNNIFHQYYDQYTQYWGVGIAFDVR